MAKDPQIDNQSKPVTPSKTKGAQLANTNVKEMLTQQRNFFDSHRGAVVTNKHTFYHPIVERIYRRNFDQMSEYLHFIPVFGRVLIEKEEDVLKIEVHVKNSIIKHTAELQKRLRECDVTYSQNSLVAPSTFINGVTVDVKLTSPLARIYYELHDTADRFLMTMSDLWVRGLLHPEDFELNEKKRSDFELEVKRMLNTVMGTIARQHRAILNRIRREQQSASQKESAAASKADTPETGDADVSAIEVLEDTPHEPVAESVEKAA